MVTSHYFSTLPISRVVNLPKQKPLRRVDCGFLKDATWDGTDPVPQKLSASSVILCRPSKSLDGLALFQLCQSRPGLKELKVSAASFTSPMHGQWNLRRLEKLHIEFEEADDHSVEKLLEHASNLYLKDLKVTYTGPGFANLHASSLANLHFESIKLEGFVVQRSAQLARKTGQLVDCVLDVSRPDLDTFFGGAQGLTLDRCRLSGALSWRFWVPLAVVVGFLMTGLMVNKTVTINFIWSVCVCGFITNVFMLALKNRN